jgi:hypothetical protein
VVVLNIAPPVLQHEVLKGGRLIYEGDREARMDFEVQAGKMYGDLKHMYGFFTERLIRDLQEVGLSGRRPRHCRTSAAAR